jgi:hypothetical protein
LYNFFRLPYAYQQQNTAFPIHSPNINTTLITIVESDWDKDLLAISKKLPGGKFKTEYLKDAELNCYFINVHLDDIKLNAILGFKETKTDSIRTLTIAATSVDSLENQYDMVMRIVKSSDNNSTILKDFENVCILVKIKRSRPVIQ